MTDYTLTPRPDDPPWATSREPAPHLWLAVKPDGSALYHSGLLTMEAHDEAPGLWRCIHFPASVEGTGVESKDGTP